MVNKKYVFLAIDDQADNLTSLKALLLEAFPNSEVFTYLNGVEGFEAAKKYEPDVILLDILMPGIDGFGLCKIIKQDEVLADTPVIFVTALKSDKETRLQAIENGGESFLTKPVDELELYVQIRAMLKIREANVMKRSEKDKLKYLLEEKTKNITELKEKYQNMLDDLPALICEFLPDSTLTYANKTYCNYFNAKNEKLLGTKLLDLLNLDEKAPTIMKYMALTPENPSNRYFRKIEFEDKISWYEWRDRAIFDNNNEVKHFYSIGVDVTERKQAEEKLLHFSYHDFLTNLYNRRFFEEEVKRLDKERNLPITIIMADVNGLKLINDSFGHKAGDELLVKAASAIKEGCREDDIVARIGGDEFAVLLPNTDRMQAEEILKRIKTVIGEEVGVNYILSISFGFGTKINGKENINDIFAEAENHMYQHKMYESVSMRSKTIDVIMNSLYEKSNRELMHSKRVGDLCYNISSQMGFDSEEANVIKTAGLVHDIGKIGVDEKVLNKIGKLDEDEWKEIKNHPEAGWRILSSVKEFSEIAEYVLNHHEMWSGKGYPKGLIGDQIPIEARIIAVADAFDAMTSSRSYRTFLDEEAAIKELKNKAGIQFDPKVVEAFLSIHGLDM